MAGGHALHAHREDVAHTALGIALGLLLDLAHNAGGVVADPLLDLLDQHLLGLGHAEAGDALELADVLLLALLEQLALAVELTRAIFERALALLELRPAGVELALLGEQGLLGPAELGAALAPLGGDLDGRGSRGDRRGNGGDHRASGAAGDGHGGRRTAAAEQQRGSDHADRENHGGNHDFHVRFLSILSWGASDRAAPSAGCLVCQRAGARRFSWRLAERSGNDSNAVGLKVHVIRNAWFARISRPRGPKSFAADDGSGVVVAAQTNGCFRPGHRRAAQSPRAKARIASCASSRS